MILFLFDPALSGLGCLAFLDGCTRKEKDIHLQFTTGFPLVFPFFSVCLAVTVVKLRLHPVLFCMLISFRGGTGLHVQPSPKYLFFLLFFFWFEPVKGLLVLVLLYKRKQDLYSSFFPV